MILHPPAAGVVTVSVQDPLLHGEAAFTVVHGQIDAGVGEADQIVTAIAVHVGHEAGMAVDTPAFVIAEGVGDLDGFGEAVAGGDGEPGAGVGEADDVDAAVAVHIGEQAGVPVRSPAGVVAEGVECEDGLGEAAAGGEREVDAGIGEADDVGAAVAVHIAQVARVVLDPPAAGFEGVRGEHAFRRGESPAGGEGQIDAVVREGDDVRLLITVHIAKQTRILGGQARPGRQSLEQNLRLPGGGTERNRRDGQQHEGQCRRDYSRFPHHSLLISNVRALIGSATCAHNSLRSPICSRVRSRSL